MQDGEILEPTFLIQGARDDSEHELLIAFLLEGMYGLASIKVRKGEHSSKDTLPRFWSYQLKQREHELTVEVKPEIQFFHGRISTPRTWKPCVHVCTQEQRPLVVGWIEELNSHIKLENHD